MLQKAMWFFMIGISCFHFLSAQNFIKSKQQNQKYIGKKYIYYDGQKTKEIYLMDNLIAEFGNTRFSYVKSLDPSAQSFKQLKGITVYSIRDLSIKIRLKKGTFTKNLNGYQKISEVFRSPSGTLMALPGNIIIKFKDGVPSSFIESFFQKRNLKVIRIQNIGKKQYYIIQSQPGLVSLELANQLKKTVPEIEFSQPDWWKEYSLR